MNKFLLEPEFPSYSLEEGLLGRIEELAGPDTEM
jgi:hypothetical protein